MEWMQILGVAMTKAEMVRFLTDFGGFMEMVKEKFLVLIHTHDFKHDILFRLVDHGLAFFFSMPDSIGCPI